MLKLLTCPQGHYWEKHVEDDADGSRAHCPVCGHVAETMPLLDEASSEVPPAAPAEPLPPPSLRDKDGRPLIAGYEILQDLGKGPTGVYLYRARQLLVNRIVLLKVVFAKDDPGQFAWGSLRGEAGALGRLTHPNIVAILDAGERDRQLFYNAVEHVDGPTLAEALDGKPLPIRQAIALVETLARAVQHAHDKNVLHRSLKPASILLQRKDEGGRMKDEKKRKDNSSSPFRLHPSSFIPKITHFGLARRPIEGESADVELQGELPCYLSPEQAWGRVKEIGPATDVYGLGAILYELLAGEPPFRAETVAQTLDAIQCKGLRPPSRLRSRVPADLDAICRKCLAKQPRRRYATALQLAEDLRRCADGYPIRATAASGAERLGKWTRRNFRGVALVLLSLWAVVSLLVLILGRDSDPAALRNPREQGYRQAVTRLESELAQARQREAAASYLRYLTLAEREIQGGDSERGKDLLEQCPVDQRHWEWYYLRSRSRKQGNTDSVFTSAAPVTSVDLSRDGQYLAIGAGSDPAEKPQGGKGEVSVWDLATRRNVWRAIVPAPVRAVAFSPNSTYLALVSSEGRDQDNEVQARWTRAGGLAFPPRHFPDSQLTTIAYSSDQMVLLTAGGDGFVRSLDAENGRELLAQPVEFRQVWPGGGEHARLVPLSPDHERLALISPNGSQVVLLQDLTGASPIDLRGHDNTTILALAYDEHSETLATASRDRTVRLWSVRYPYQTTSVLRGHKGAVTGVAFSSDGKRVAACGEDGTIHIWEPEQGQELLTIKGYNGATGVVFSRDKNRMQFADNRPSLDRLAIVHGNKVTVLAPQAFDRHP
jgi:serine/threonine protein kinase